MNQWLVFSYSLSTKGQTASTARVAIWRRLRRIGAVAMAGSGLYVLPDQRGCLESFQWLAKEIKQSNGDAVIMRVAEFENLSEADVIKLFHQARAEDYAQIDTELSALETQLKTDALADLKQILNKLQIQHDTVLRVDYFHSPDGERLAHRINRLTQLLAEDIGDDPRIERTYLKDFKDKNWVTRPRPHVDRLASAWLIRRFIDPDAVIHYRTKPQKNEISFDFESGTFTHMGNLCTFEVMILSFGLKQKGLSKLAEIVHDIDLQDGRYVHSEAGGIVALLNGWLKLNWTDQQLEQHGIALFEGLYQTISKPGKG